MKLSFLAFDDLVLIPGGRQIGPDAVVDLKESTFRVEDGWDLHRILVDGSPVFSLQAPWMPEAAFVEGFGATYRVPAFIAPRIYARVIKAPEAPPEPPQDAKGKRR